MLLAILIIISALGYSIRSEQKGGMIARHSYNNRDNDASGARDDHFG